LIDRSRVDRTEGTDSVRAAAEAILLDRTTGLPTVAMALDKLKEVLIEQSEMGILFVDIEQFESIEAEYGWAFFDEFLRRAGDAVRDAEQQRKRQLTRELRDIIRRKRLTTLFQPIVHARELTVFGYEVLTRGPAHSSFRNSDMLFSFAREAKLAWALEAISL